MPAQIPNLPSLGIETLAAGLRERGHAVDVLYLNLEMVKHIGLRRYFAIALEGSWLRKFGEWLYSHPSITPGAADVPTMQRFLTEKNQEYGIEPLPQFDLLRLRRTAEALLDRWTEEISWSSYDVVGFTVMFQQLNASLRLAHRIKDRSSGTRVVLGGSGLEQPMGGAVYARYPFLDALFTGYSERSFPAWVEELPRRADRAISDEGVPNLDELPMPSFDDYIGALERHGLRRRLDPRVLIETSRGCWYGEKQHCTFCGINGIEMRYRHKSADRVFDEVRALSRYGLPLWSSDAILPLEFFDTLFPRLEREKVRFNGFYEIKSNSDRAELETLARVGIKSLQPGIESFSTHTLKLMKKGVTGIQNVWFVRAAREIGLACQWNILWGFPDERPAEYEKLAELLPKISHLEPPSGVSKIHVLRHSPNHSRAEELGFSDVRPAKSYELAFGHHEGLADQAYLFDYGYADGRQPESYVRRVDLQTRRWKALERRHLLPVCQVVSVFGRRFVVDTRRRGTVGLALPRIRVLDDDAWALLQALESPVPRNRLEREWNGRSPLAPLLEELIRDDLAVESDGRVVRLVVIRDEPSLLAGAGRVAAENGRALRAVVQRYV
jgi:ribosomal peptide maturation radical SAM protein 1